METQSISINAALQTEIDRKNVITMYIKRWFKVTDRPIHPFRERGKCWYGIDGIVSQTQLELDRICTMNSGGITACARCDWNQFGLYCYCVDFYNLDYSRAEKRCVNNCNKEVNCLGVPFTFGDTHMKRLYRSDYKDFLYRNCVVSRVQDDLDKMCGEGMAARLYSYELICMLKKDLNYDELGYCWDDCGVAVKCYGHIQSYELKKRVYLLSEIPWDNYITHCPCNESVSSTAFVKYVGCQNKSIAGNTCRQWRTIPDLKVKEVKRSVFIRNYCRNLDEKDGIFCYTSDNVVERCNTRYTTTPTIGYNLEVQNRRMTLQPGQFFDLWITPYNPPYSVHTTLLNATYDCGHTSPHEMPISRVFAFQPYDIYTGKWSQALGKHRRDSYPSLAVGMQTMHVIRGFKTIHAVSEVLKVCACLASPLYYDAQKEVPCKYQADYTVHIGTISIKGEHVTNKTVFVERSMQASVDLYNVSRTSVISMVPLAYVEESARHREGTQYLLSVDHFSQADDDNLTQMTRVAREGPEKLVPHTTGIISRATVRGQLATATLGVSKPGEYMLISRTTPQLHQPRHKLDPHQVLGHYVFTGYDRELEVTLLNVDSSGPNGIPQAIFFRSWKIKHPPSSIVLSLVGGPGPCDLPFGFSYEVAPVADYHIDEGEALWRATTFSVNSSKWQAATAFNVCLLDDGKYGPIMLGSGKKAGHLDHKMTLLHHGLTEIASSISTYTLQDEWDLLRMHGFSSAGGSFKAYIEEQEVSSASTAMPVLDLYLSSNNCDCASPKPANTTVYPLVFSFWCLKEANRVMIFSMTPNMVSPTYFGQITVDQPLSFELVVEYDHMHALVLSEGQQEVADYRINVVNGEDVKFEMTFKTSSCSAEACVTMGSPSDMKLIRYQVNCQRRHLVIVTDPALNCIFLLNGELRLSDKLCKGDLPGTEGILEPGKISCTILPSATSCIMTVMDTNRVAYANCFVTQKHEGSLLWLRVYFVEETLQLMNVYTGEHHRSGNEENATAFLPLLTYPSAVEAASYGTTDFIYLIESEVPKIHTFLVDNKAETPELLYYGVNEPEGVPYSAYVTLKSIHLSQMSTDAVVNNDYLILLRRPVDAGLDDREEGYVTMLNVKDTVRVSDFDYAIPNWVLVGQQIEQEPQIEGLNAHFNSLTRYDLDVINDPWRPQDDTVECVDRGPPMPTAMDKIGPALAPLDLEGSEDDSNVIYVSPVGGKLVVNLRNTQQITVTLRIMAVGPIDAKCIYKTLSVACPDGHYFYNDPDAKKRGCRPCEPGSYNSIVIIEKDLTKWGECTKCPPNESTTGTAAISPSQCMCAPGYYLDEGGSPRCKPCPKGTWKSVVGSHDCVDKGCYNNSDSDVTGSTSEEGRKCACRRGFYYRELANNQKECAPCEEGYYCEGGFRGIKMPCPVNMTTAMNMALDLMPGQNPGATSLNDCVCKAGYEPANPKKIHEPGSPEYQLKMQVIAELTLRKIQNYTIDNIVCTPCSQDKYKEDKGGGKCIPCPDNTFSELAGTNSVAKCNRCAPGYFETGDPSNPCELCPPNHICVGSDPVDPDLAKHWGKKIKCHRNSITIPPYHKNVTMSHCLCDKGYTSSKELGISCEPVPKYTYKDVIGNVGASNCPSGSYTLSTAATDVSECVCKEGKYFDLAAQSCTVCPIGYYCRGGKSQDGNHAQPIECPDPNATTKKTGSHLASQCLCNAGYYMRSDGLGICIKCPQNTYKGHVSNEPCAECDEHSSTGGKVGATSKEQCVCAPGYYFDRTCKPCGYPDKYCPGGAILSRDSTTGRDVYETRAPVQCPPHTEITPGIDTADSVDSCKCAKGYALAKKEDEQAEKLRDGLELQRAVHAERYERAGSVQPGSVLLPAWVLLPGGRHLRALRGGRELRRRAGAAAFEPAESGLDRGLQRPREAGSGGGYYLDKIKAELRKPDDWRFIKCPIKGACLGEKGCSESMTAYLCAECKMGYTNNFKKGALCSKCPSTATNLLLTIAWYLGLLLVNIVMACLNVSAGFNRRSIHSVVIKIALNYGICMSVLNVINFSELALPEELKSITLRWFKMLYRESKTYYTSIDCLLQNWFGMRHADSFFYSMLFIACLPVILLVVVTVLMWVILELFKIKCHAITRSKLALLHQSSVQGMHYLSERLREEYSNERLFLIFRYIPLPGETRWVRFKHFLEDMIPIYVTVLFSVHGNTTSQMLSLLDCTCIHLGQSIPSKYVLRPAMSIKCSLDPSKGYVPYLLLGLGGLIFWGFGIPFFSYIVLLMNRKNLYAPDVRMKYGFLHNGYQQDYWFWEAIVFTRKSLVLVIGSIVIVPSQNTSGSRIWMALSVAVIFLIIQLIYKPFDERDYFVLGRLESHSMISWTMTLIICLFAIEGEFSAYNNMYLLTMISIINFCFIAEVVLELGLAYCDNVRSHKSDCSTSFISHINRSLASISERRKMREPLIIFNEVNRTIDLASPKFTQWYYSEEANRKLTYAEKVYFTHIMTEVINFANIHMRLDIIPTDFTEFILRLAFAVNYHELNKKKANDIVKSLAGGNLEELVNLTMLESRESRIQASQLASFQSSIDPGEKEYVVPPSLLFDKDVISNGVPLSDFYMALSIIKMKDIYMIVRTYNAFKVLREHADQEILMEQEEKVSQVKEILRRIHDPKYKTMDEIFCSHDDIEEAQRRIEDLEHKIKMFKENPLKAYNELGYLTFEEQMAELGFQRRDLPNRAQNNRRNQAE
ncbi:kringle domain-containing protein [Babesia caballi]|uniref:Kringle domain-containing protein n=1 Tax=Babesia caballi TaxID=5871 RepID=A0AAV4LUL0_BABCB|nr:kringle domain-containing protein [Babesia caballi]